MGLKIRGTRLGNMRHGKKDGIAYVIILAHSCNEVLISWVWFSEDRLALVSRNFATQIIYHLPQRRRATSLY